MFAAKKQEKKNEIWNKRKQANIMLFGAHTNAPAQHKYSWLKS